MGFQFSFVHKIFVVLKDVDILLEFFPSVSPLVPDILNCIGVFTVHGCESFRTLRQGIHKLFGCEILII